MSANYMLVFPDGSREEMIGATVPAEGGQMTSGVVSYVSRRFGEWPVVYLDSIGGQKMAIFLVDGGKYSLSPGELAQLDDRLRRLAGGSLVSSATTVAVRIEQLIEDAVADSGSMEFFPSEKAVLRSVIGEWLNDVGAEAFPPRVMELRYALHAEATAGSG
jgi:hypothetical protein